MTVTAEEIYAVAPFAETLGVRFAAISAPEVRARLDYASALSTLGGALHGGALHGGALHGGALMGLADVAAAVCAAVNGPESTLPATMQSNTLFLRPVRGTGAFATARPLHVGRNTVTVEVDINDEQDVLCVRITQVVALRTPPSQA
ncbi:PaaI family thioesterase [Streptomyces mirabilis]|uniref:PaaI family thioesterase n=1 Tax=Streptomyces mirabilis TaxID=68239 RepID=UPI0036CDA868